MSSEDEDNSNIDSDEIDEDDDDEGSNSDDLMGSQVLKFGINKTDILKRRTLYENHSQQAKRNKFNSGKYDDELEALFYVSTPCRPWLDEEEAQARGIDLDSDVLIGIKFTSPKVYMYSKPTITIRQTKNKELDEIRENEIHAFGLTWPLEDRAKRFIDNNFDKLSQQCTKDETELWKLTDGVEGLDNFLDLLGGSNITEVEKIMYGMILKESKGDTMAALGVANSKKKENYKKEAEKIHKNLEENLKKSNLLILLTDFIQKSIIDITSECLICGSKQQVVLFKPTVCEKQLCNFSFLNLGLGLDIESEIRFSPIVVDLLISLTYAGAYGRKDHFSPFPTIDEKVTEQNQIGDIIKKFPNLKVMQEFIIKKSFLSSMKELDPSSNNVYRLLRWIITSNKCHLAFVPKDLHFNGMDTELQFILKSTPPEKEKKFRELKKEYGSFYGFHGSPIGNWHSILRNGLTNKAYAQAFGPGIYLAKDGATSVGYLYRGGMGSGTSNWPSSDIGTTDLKCMAMCEIIDWSSKEPNKHCRGGVHRIGCHHNKSSPYIRVENDDLLVTRFFFVWNKTSNPSVTFVADTSANLIQKTIEKLTSLKN